MVEWDGNGPCDQIIPYRKLAGNAVDPNRAMCSVVPLSALLVEFPFRQPNAGAQRTNRVSLSIGNFADIVERHYKAIRGPMLEIPSIGQMPLLNLMRINQATQNPVRSCLRRPRRPAKDVAI
jgi:hypothetical protein